VQTTTLLAFQTLTGFFVQNNNHSKSAEMGVEPSQMELADSEAENPKPNQTKTVSTPIAEVIAITETNAPETFLKIKQETLEFDCRTLYYDYSKHSIL
jgi:hypothetical protein